MDVFDSEGFGDGEIDLESGEERVCGVVVELIGGGTLVFGEAGGFLAKSAQCLERTTGGVFGFEEVGGEELNLVTNEDEFFHLGAHLRSN